MNHSSPVNAERGASRRPRAVHLILRGVPTVCLGVVAAVCLHCDKPGPGYENIRPDSLNLPRESDLRYEYFIIWIDSLKAPDSLPHTDTLRVWLFGTIGLCLSHRLGHVGAELGEHEVDLIVWGKRPRDFFGFVPSGVSLREPYDIFPVTQGVFRFRVHQPDGTILSDSTVVF